jgi:DNA-binding IclR family transcriptional regulator
LSAVLCFLNEHPGEVFLPMRCSRIARAIGAPESTVALALWTLSRHGLIGKANAMGHCWYGSHETIETLKRTQQLPDRRHPNK